MNDRTAPSMALTADYQAPGLYDLITPDQHGWAGVDLDGTLAEYTGWRGDDSIGEPVPEMVDRVRSLIACGVEVRIVTARVDALHTPEELAANRQRIAEWTLRHIGTALPATAAKDRRMTVLFDDRAVRVSSNRGCIAELEIRR